MTIWLLFVILSLPPILLGSIHIYLFIYFFLVQCYSLLSLLCFIIGRYETKVVKKISEGILDGLSMKKMNLIMLSMIGMNGIGGVGKIFVTKAIYNFLSFLTNVREVFLDKI